MKAREMRCRLPNNALVPNRLLSPLLAWIEGTYSASVLQITAPPFFCPKKGGCENIPRLHGHDKDATSITLRSIAKVFHYRQAFPAIPCGRGEGEYAQ